MPKKTRMRLINLVDTVSQLNYGIWNTITSDAEAFRIRGIDSELWFPAADFSNESITTVPLASVSVSTIDQQIKVRGLNASNDIIISHGCWHFPTRWGNAFRKKNFKWVALPHGMLDPWAMKQKAVKKLIYYNLFEKRMLSQAHVLRAVSHPESERLNVLFPGKNVQFIGNGVEVIDNIPAKSNHKRTYLFMSRLHHKKNIIPLLEAWSASTLNNQQNVELKVAGPDQGELAAMSTLINNSENISYVGTVYGEEKKQLLRKAHFYVLPSFSEGLPTSLLEGMSYGLVPIISDGCNLPQVFASNIGINSGTEVSSIRSALESSLAWTDDQIRIIG
ncbi:MAG: glycosyltransferase, partial [Chitinophagaceae bacterium]